MPVNAVTYVGITLTGQPEQVTRAAKVIFCLAQEKGLDEEGGVGKRLDGKGFWELLFSTGDNNMGHVFCAASRSLEGPNVSVTAMLQQKLVPA